MPAQAEFTGSPLATAPVGSVATSLHSVASPARRVFGLDILRTVAILAVVHAHGYYLIQHQIEFRYYSPLVLDGVSIFFVLSGFLIGRILIDMFEQRNFGRRSLLQFWIRRWFRTLPAYYLVLGTLLAAFVYRTGEWPWKFQKLLTFTQNLTRGPPNWFEEAWSLAVEEWFYLCIPFLLFLIQRRRRGLLIIIFGVIFASMAFRTSRVFRLGNVLTFSSLDWTEQITMPVACRMETLMLGVLAAYLMKHYGDSLRKFARPLFFLGVFLITATGQHMFLSDPAYVALFMNFAYVTMLGIGAMLVLPLLSSIQFGNGMVASAVTFISKISYPMYLTNLVLAQIIILPLIIAPSGFLALTIWWALTIGLSYAIHKMVEIPFMNLRDHLRFEPKRLLRQ